MQWNARKQSAIWSISVGFNTYSRTKKTTRCNRHQSLRKVCQYDCPCLRRGCLVHGLNSRYIRNLADLSNNICSRINRKSIPRCKS
jgi:hypothetical protein